MDLSVVHASSIDTSMITSQKQPGAVGVADSPPNHRKCLCEEAVPILRMAHHQVRNWLPERVNRWPPRSRHVIETADARVQEYFPELIDSLRGRSPASK